MEIDDIAARLQRVVGHVQRVHDSIKNTITSEQNAENKQMNNIYAYTEVGDNYPGYVSLNRDGDKYKLIVRTPGHGGQAVAGITLSADNIKSLANDILAHIDMNTRKFIAVWGESFTDHSGEAVVKHTTMLYFGDSNGYSQKDRDGIMKLAIGESWSADEYNDHTVVRVA